VIGFGAYLALNHWIIEEIRRTTSADASSTIQPIIVDILTEGKSGSSSFLHPDWSGLTSEDAMEASKVQTKGDLLMRRNSELNFV
jgi:hypothetical protein